MTCTQHVPAMYLLCTRKECHVLVQDVMYRYKTVMYWYKTVMYQYMIFLYQYMTVLYQYMTSCTSTRISCTDLVLSRDSHVLVHDCLVPVHDCLVLVHDGLVPVQAGYMKVLYWYKRVMYWYKTVMYWYKLVMYWYKMVLYQYKGLRMAVSSTRKIHLLYTFCTRQEQDKNKITIAMYKRERDSLILDKCLFLNFLAIEHCSSQLIHVIVLLQKMHASSRSPGFSIPFLSSLPLPLPIFINAYQ